MEMVYEEEDEGGQEGWRCKEAGEEDGGARWRYEEEAGEEVQGGGII